MYYVALALKLRRKNENENICRVIISTNNEIQYRDQTFKYRIDRSERGFIPLSKLTPVFLFFSFRALGFKLRSRVNPACLKHFDFNTVHSSPFVSSSMIHPGPTSTPATPQTSTMLLDILTPYQLSARHTSRKFVRLPAANPDSPPLFVLERGSTVAQSLSKSRLAGLTKAAASSETWRRRERCEEPTLTEAKLASTRQRRETQRGREPRGGKTVEREVGTESGRLGRCVVEADRVVSASALRRRRGKALEWRRGGAGGAGVVQGRRRRGGRVGVGQRSRQGCQGRRRRGGQRMRRSVREVKLSGGRKMQEESTEGWGWAAVVDMYEWGV
ncbi:hypothetical protein R3P38DRAFT_3464466 [Favolaschia claudopus]|uniref:Uncharacterized protein n=1 Tax=Favolaschia claudopus TaxID=2862362 RepID=A0AAV9ZFQ5_9AGAR